MTFQRCPQSNHWMLLHGGYYNEGAFTCNYVKDLKRGKYTGLCNLHELIVTTRFLTRERQRTWVKNRDVIAKAEAREMFSRSLKTRDGSSPETLRKSTALHFSPLRLVLDLWLLDQQVMHLYCLNPSTFCGFLLIIIAIRNKCPSMLYGHESVGAGYNPIQSCFQVIL